MTFLKGKLTFIIFLLLTVYCVSATVLLIKITSQKQKTTLKKQTVTEDYPECRFDRCPKYFPMDVDGDHLSESVVVQSTAMSQGAGKVLIIKDGKKIFETGEMTQIWVKAVDDGNGFILQYSSPRDQNMKTTNYEIRYKFINGQFIAGNEIQI